ncbi:MAG: glycosyltransferase family 2 protein, partial [Patescibacteria group bacterium]
MKSLSIIILSYNVQKLILDCLASIPTHPDWEIIVPDNGSTDDSVSQIKKKFPKVKIIENQKNLGFAAGNNIGINKSEGEYVLLLNPDTIVYPNTIETVLEYLKKNLYVGAATCRVELADGSLDYSSHRGFPDPIGSLLHFIGLKNLSNYSSGHLAREARAEQARRSEGSIHEIDSLTGAFALIRRSAGDQVGWLDEDYFWNGEDLDF